MKKLILAFALLAFIMVACGEKKGNNSAQDPEVIELQKQVESIDSTTKEIENVKKEIDESSEKLDELLDDL